MSIADILDKGGIIVWILLAYSFVAMTIVIERLIHYILMGRPTDSFENKMHKAISENRLEDELNAMNGPEARLMQGIFNARKNNVIDLQSVAVRYGSTEVQTMERGYRTLSILGHTAPLLGLLGTIIGMIKAFMVIQLAGGQVDAQALAGGIWEAMLTTGVGLAVAIPVFLLLNMLESLADKRANIMRSYSMILLEHFSANNKIQPSGSVSSNASHHRHGGIHAV